MKRILIVLAAAALLGLLLPGALHACPNCKEAFMETDAGAVPVNFNASIVFMMTMPFVIMGGIGTRIWLAMRRRAAAEAEEFRRRMN